MRIEAPLRVLHVTHPALVGGLERVVQALAEGQRRRGLDVRVVTVVSDGEAHPFAELLRSTRVPTTVLTLPGRAYLAERRALRRLCLEMRPHIMHTHGNRADVLASPIARGLGIATVATEHGSTMLAGKGRVYEFLQRRAHRRFDALVVVSRALAERARRDGVAPEVIHCVPNAWQQLIPPLPRKEARLGLGLDDSTPAVGWIARMVEVKDPALFVRAAAHLVDRQISFVMIGDGPERSRTEALAASLSLSGRIRFAGALSDAARFVCAFDAWVLTSRSEGTPIALFEALAARVPVVATAVGGVPDVLSSFGLTVPAGDAAAMATAIAATLDDPTAAAVRAEGAARRLAEEYPLEPWLARYEAIYASVARRDVA